MAKPRKDSRFEVFGQEMIEKVVAKSGNSGRIYLPPDWIGKRVRIIRVEGVSWRRRSQDPRRPTPPRSGGLGERSRRSPGPAPPGSTCGGSGNGDGRGRASPGG